MQVTRSIINNGSNTKNHHHLLNYRCPQQVLAPTQFVGGNEARGCFYLATACHISQQRLLNITANIVGCRYQLDRRHSWRQCNCITGNRISVELNWCAIFLEECCTSRWDRCKLLTSSINDKMGRLLNIVVFPTSRHLSFSRNISYFEHLLDIAWNVNEFNRHHIQLIHR